MSAGRAAPWKREKRCGLWDLHGGGFYLHDGAFSSAWWCPCGGDDGIRWGMHPPDPLNVAGRLPWGRIGPADGEWPTCHCGGETTRIWIPAPAYAGAGSARERRKDDRVFFTHSLNASGSRAGANLATPPLAQGSLSCENRRFSRQWLGKCGLKAIVPGRTGGKRQQGTRAVSWV